MRSLSMGGGVSLPNVSYTVDENKVYYNPIQPSNEIWYTTTDGNIGQVYSGATTPFLDVDGNNIEIISNNYKNGKGIIKLEKDCYQFGENAFFRSNLSEIIIPQTVTTIGKFAFLSCRSLAGIAIPNKVSSIGYGAFSGCTSLTRIAIPDSVTSIGDYAFHSCTSLTGITIPDSVTSIGECAFAGWTGATSTDNITFPNEQLKIKYFEGNYAFNNWASLTSVTIPDKVTSIGQGAFYRCSSLTSITIPDSVTEIGDSTFLYCTSLTRIAIPDSVTSIGDEAFGGWTGATSTDNIIFPNEQLKIKYFEGDSAFDNWASLISVIIPNGVTSIGESAFSSCTSLTGITIPDSVTSIGQNAFYGCSSLIEITIPDSVTTIGQNAFSNCSSLTGITIPDSVTSIGDEAFYNCTKVSSITIPESVTTIGFGAFYNCSKLSSITVLPATPPSLDFFAFNNIASDAVIYVPSGSVDAYKTATNWSTYADKIQAISE